ncbi:MAG: HAD-IIIA family hydrolase [Alphaproteobacteria bacterium]|nr:HAD-IIIA family hydrolase [Alphaproteobacteria bacterium]
MLVLLDRDGVLVEDRPDYVKHPGELRLLPGAAEAVARLNAAGHLVAVCTNQSCIGRGLVAPDMLDRIHEALRAGLAMAGGRLDALHVCPDPPWAASERRKPAPGMLREAMAGLRVAPEDSVMIGDQLRDLEAARRAGCGRILVRTGRGAATLAEGLPEEVLPVRVAEDLAQAVAMLLEGAG